MRCGSMTQGRPPELKDPQRMEIYTDQDTRDILSEALVRTNWGEQIRGYQRSFEAYRCRIQLLLHGLYKPCLDPRRTSSQHVNDRSLISNPVPV